MTLDLAIAIISSFRKSPTSVAFPPSAMCCRRFWEVSSGGKLGWEGGGKGTGNIRVCPLHRELCRECVVPEATEEVSCGGDIFCKGFSTGHYLIW